MALTGVRAAWSYVNEAFGRWWWAVFLGSVGAYEVVANTIPGLPRLNSDGLQWLALVVLLVAPLTPYVGLKKRFERTEAALAQRDLEFAMAFRESWINTFLTERARRSPVDQANELRALLDERKSAIEAGDLSRVSEIIPIAEHYAAALHALIPRGSVALPNAQAELRPYVELAERILFSGRPKLPPAMIPPGVSIPPKSKSA